tara:strand:+ start:193 stop:741 length:549 start_codon:yes stop_codon:yes gene_type:complete
MTLIEDFIHCKNYVNNNECDHILNLMKDYRWHRHLWYSPTKGQTHYEEKDCEVCTPNEEVNNILISKMKLALEDYIKKTKSMPEIFHRVTNPRLNKYSVGQNMREHYDHIHSIFDGEKKGIPVLSLVGLLNDNFEGGEFYINNKPIELNRGDILIFPSCFIYPHTVKSLTKGNRFTYVSWAF